MKTMQVLPKSTENPMECFEFQGRPYAHLLDKRNLEFLWMVRILVNLGCLKRLAESRWEDTAAALLDSLQLQDIVLADSAQRQEFSERMTVTLRLMEERRAAFEHPPVLRENLALISRALDLSVVERHVFTLAALLHQDNLWRGLAGATDDSINLPQMLAWVLKEPEEEISHAISAGALLRRAGLIVARSGGCLRENLIVRRGTLRRVVTQKLGRVDELFPDYLRQSPAPDLSCAAYAHMDRQLDLVCRLMKEALENRRGGVNVLIYGPPGTGKTQFSRVVAAALGRPLYDVSATDMGMEPKTPAERLQTAAICQALLKNRESLLVFDECDTVFNMGDTLLGPAAADEIKAWVNQLLESTAVPIFWIANRVSRMDPAFIRRFDMALHLDTPSRQVRSSLLDQTCGSVLSAAQKNRLSGISAITPGILARAASVMRRLSQGDEEAGQTLELLLDHTLRAQGHGGLRALSRNMSEGGHDIGLWNVDLDLSRLAAGLKRAGQGRVLLYGPPGTGKTAFGHWLAAQLDRPLLLKRVSDIQSPYVGKTEQNLAAAFDEAIQDDAILQMDEIESFLPGRRRATAQWQVTVVNELLMQLESYEGIFIATTNMLEVLEPAALRRFDYKLQFGALRQEQKWRFLSQKASEWGLDIQDEARCRHSLAALDNLTPGDFAVVERKHALTPYGSIRDLLEALAEETAFKDGNQAKMGFL